MQNKNNVLAIYDANKVVGRSEFCPRKGFYRILSTYSSTCLGKPAKMATANWKPSVEDTYTDNSIIIQLESFKTGLSPLNTCGIIGKEIVVNSAIWYPAIPLFAVNWELKTSTQSLLDHVNARLANGSTTIDLDHTADIDEEIEKLAKKGRGF